MAAEGVKVLAVGNAQVNISWHVHGMCTVYAWRVAWCMHVVVYAWQVNISWHVHGVCTVYAWRVAWYMHGVVYAWQVNISGATPTACTMHTDKLGDFDRLSGHEVNGTALYKRKDSDVRLWQATLRVE